MRSLLAPILVTATLFAATGCADATDADSSAVYTVLEKGGEQLREEFNRAKGSVRLIFVVDPVCPGCLRGLDDVDRDLLSKTEDPRLQIYVVHVPVIGAEGKDVAPATKLLHNAQVRHYWNPSGSFGRELAEAIDLKRGKEVVYAWDVWLIYGPEAVWDGKLPPRPDRLMHQLKALQGSKEFPHLDSEVYAREVHQLLAQLPAAPNQ